MQLIDTHCHFDHERFDADRPQALERAQRAGVEQQIVPAIAYRWWGRVRETCHSTPTLHATYGLHPMFMDEHQSDHLNQLATWIEQEQPVAVGECGLDFYIPTPDREAQQQLFEGQLEIAQHFGLPVIIHARKAVEQVIQSVRRYPKVSGVLHSYSGSLEQAHQLADMGFLMSFGGPITYDRATRLRNVVANLPLESILLETDAPDQPDAEHRGERNEPARLPRVLEAISELRDESADKIARATTANAKNLFNI